MEWDEGGPLMNSEQSLTDHPEAYDAGEARDPTTRLRICCCDVPNAFNRQGVSVIRRRGQWIWKHLLPRLEVVCGPELDISEKVFSGTRDP